MSLDFFHKKEFVWLVFLAIFFVFVRLPAVHSPYHQDEYKWVQYSHPEIVAPGTVPHPPLTEFIYAKFLGPVVGDNNFRLIPLIFGIANLLLIFYLAKIIFPSTSSGQVNKTTLWSAGLFTISFYSVLASLMVDVDGAVMPFFFLVMLVGYFKLKTGGFNLKDGNLKWLAVLIVGAVGGFLVKVSGVLPIFALALDFAFEKNVFKDKVRILKYFALGLFGVITLVIVLFLAKYIFPFFNLEYSLNYWKHFANSSSFLDRGWLQTFIQFAKAVMYTSPLLLLPLLFIDKEIWRKTRPFFLFIFIGLFFYLFAFDFSIGAMDRYFQFLIVPLCLISGAVFTKIFSNKEEKLEKIDFITISIISVAIFVLQFFNHFVPALYPKTEWINRVISLKWNFLFPFTGGSGPTGFYISFVFLALIWICLVIFALSHFRIKNIQKRVFFCILILGLLYNTVFVEEYLFGKINGSATKLAVSSVEFIKNNLEIKKVIVYDNNAGWSVMQTGKYERRTYTTPQFEDEYKKILDSFNGHILFIDIPKISDDSFYTSYMNSCKVIYVEKDKYITAKVLGCGKNK